MKLLKIILVVSLPLFLILGCKKSDDSSTSTTTTTTSSACPTDNNTITCSYTATSSTDDCSFLKPAQTAYTDLRSGTCSTVTTIPCAKAPRTFGTCLSPGDSEAKSFDDFYQKYVLAYDDDCSEWTYAKSIPIIGTSTTSPLQMEAGRKTVVNMLRPRPWRTSPWDVRDKMLEYYNLVVAAGDEVRNTSTKFGDHPTAGSGDELGGASTTTPETGYEPYGSCYQGNTGTGILGISAGRDVLIEEYGHSIEEIAIKNLDPCTYARIGKQACLMDNVSGARNPAIHSCAPWPGSPSTCANEYFAAFFEYAFGDNPISTEHTGYGTKQTMFNMDPTGICLAAVFYDMRNSGTTKNSDSEQKSCDGTNGYPTTPTSLGISDLSALPTAAECEAYFKAIDDNTSTSCDTQTETGRVVPSTVCSGVTVTTSFGTFSEYSNATCQQLLISFFPTLKKLS